MVRDGNTFNAHTAPNLEVKTPLVPTDRCHTDGVPGSAKNL